ncbi:MAG: peroxide stress protein YaaA [Bacteroidota bacterium]
MLVLLSPAKSLNEDINVDIEMTKPKNTAAAGKLVKVLREYSEGDMMSLMDISSSLAKENRRRYQNFKLRGAASQSTPAVHLFAGDVYRGLGADDLTVEEMTFAQSHVRILSGLYGLLRPLDGIQPYRLEMGTSLPTDQGKNLYQFWDKQITNQINASLRELSGKTVVNLASNEYFKAVHRSKLKADVLDINFKEWRDGELKFISFSAKVARGLMTRYIIKNGITDTADLKGFDYEGYGFSPDHSSTNSWIFVR